MKELKVCLDVALSEKFSQLHKVKAGITVTNIIGYIDDLLLNTGNQFRAL